ncbi:MAG: CHASE2 domain-containing protein [Candidatus Omnitrophica bacterium]|nr:CHASE2 domain-containing protein [Candidatus Omnitrophota bacterium]
MKLRDEHPVRLLFLALSLSIIYVGILIPAGFLESARLKSYDAYCKGRNGLLAPPAQTQQILLITVDEESQRKLGKKWPWDRGVFAEFLTQLSPHEPRMVIFDFAFSGTSALLHDQALAKAIQKGPPTILASYLDRHGDPVFPLPLLTEAGALTGMINKPRDADHTVRRLWAAMRTPMRQEPLYAIEIKAAALIQGIPDDQIQLNRQLALGTRQVPLEPPGALRINYLTSPSQIATFPFWKVIQNKVPAEAIRGKIILVGSASEITHDIYPTPLGLMPGVVLSANGILTLLTERFIHPLPLWSSLAASFLGVAVILLWTYGSRFWPGLLASLAGMGIASGLGFLLFTLGFQAESMSIVFLGLGAWMIGAMYKYLLLAKAALALHRQAITEPVSGVFTGTFFKLRLEASWTQAQKGRGHSLSLLLIQTTPLASRVQEKSWEEAKAQTRSFSSCLQRLRPPNSLVGTLLDGTFGMLAPHLSLPKAQELAQRLKEELQAQVPGKAAIGLACTGAASFSGPEQLLRSAQAALTRAWENLGFNIVVYDPSVDQVRAVEEKAGAQAQTSGLSYVASEMEERNRALEKALSELRTAHQELESTFLDVTKTLVMAMETKDVYTAGHLERVSRYATRLAQALQLPKEEVEAVREAALLHDIGKIGLPDEVLHKVGKLTEEEMGVIKQHLAIGAKILEPMKFFKSITTLIYHHHEWYNGQGYPHGLAGDFIPAGAQIITIADSFDAMTTHRGYNKPLSPQEATAELKRGAHTQFNPVYVEKFAELIALEGPHLAGYAPPS